MKESLSGPAPRDIDRTIALAPSRRALIASCGVAVFTAGVAVAIFALAGLFTSEVLESQLPLLAFFGILLVIPPAWQLSNYRRARRLMNRGAVVPATFSLGRPTRGHPWPPVRATIALDGTQRSFEFAIGPGFSLPDGAVVVAFQSDVGLYLPGTGLIAARVR